MKLSIVIVSWNTQVLLRACLDSIGESPASCAFDIWVVDNQSTDGSVSMARAKYPQVHLIENHDNVGFAGANNQAIQLSSGKYVLLLNPDTVVEPNALDALIQFMDEHPDVAAAGSRLLNPDGSLQVSCYPTPTLSRELWRLLHLDRWRAYGGYQMDAWATDLPREVEVLKGASVILRRQVLEQVGLLDTDYFMYTEEVDICYRLRRAGWRIFWVPESQIIHYGGQSTKQVAADMFLQLYRSKIRFFQKHYGRVSAYLYKLVILFASLVRLSVVPILYLRRDLPERNDRLALAKNYYHLVTALPGMKPK